MDKVNFVHTHLHTDASVLDGFTQPDEYVEYAKKVGMSALAITDHGSLNNSYKFYRACIKNGVKPIIGCEFYTNENIGKVDNKDKRIDAKKDHLIVLVKNEIGWKNMLKLNHLSFSEKNFYYKSTISLNDVIRHGDGLIVTSACAASRINKLLIEGNDEEAEEWILKFQQKFKEDFYLEIQLNEIENQKKINDKLIEISKKYGVKIILTNDVHYIYKEDTKIQDTIISIAQKTTLSDKDRFSIDARHIYFANQEDFYKFNEKFNYNYPKQMIDQWLSNTMEIANKVDFKFPKTKNYPSFNVGKDLSMKYALKEDENLKYNLLVKLCVSGLKERMNLQQIDANRVAEYQSRLKRELDIINKMGYIDYFLIVWDIVNFAKEKKIRMGVARGSVGGCLVAYLLSITNLDPIRWNTILERFLSVDRFDAPDIDMDFDKDRREEIFEYLRTKYKNIIQVGTTQNFGVKNILRDCARVMDFPKEKIMIIDKICKSLSGTADLEELKKYIASNQIVADGLPEIKTLEYYVKKLLGSIRSIGSHPSGICVLDKPLEDVIPINRTDNIIVSAYTEGEDRELSELGVIKIDILGLKTVSVINATLEFIEKTRGKEEKDKAEIELNKFNWIDDPKLIKEFKSDNTGIFQFDSDSLYGFMKGLDPLNFRHLIDTTSLFRPDILMSGQAQSYIDRKNGKEIPPQYLRQNPVIKEITGETYYTFVYQEQIMFLLARIFGFTMAEANVARKYISKKKKPELVKMLNEKLGSMENKNILEEKQELKELVEMMYNFGGYSFNFSHAVAYTLISAQCAYLKMHYRTEFFSALTNYSVGDEDKLLKIFNSADNFNIDILPIDINKSGWNFTIEDKQIRAGFCLIKGLSFRSFNEIERNRTSQKDGKFASMNDFLFSTIDWGFLNKKIMESLIGLGAFDTIEPNRNKAMHMYKDFMDKTKKGKMDMSDNLFGNIKNMNNFIKLSEANVEDFSTKEKIEFEEKYLGFNYWVSLFNQHKDYIQKLRMKNILTTLDSKQKGKYVFAYLNKIKKVISKKGKTFYFAELTDITGKKEEIGLGFDKIKDQEIIEKEYYLVDFSTYMDYKSGNERYSINKMRIPTP